MVKRELTVGGLICHLASEMHFHSQKNEMNHFQMLKMFPCAISFWNMIPGSLLPHFNCVQNEIPERKTTRAPSLS